MKPRKNRDALFPTPPDLRAEDPRVLRAEIEHFRQKISEKAGKNPEKAALLLSEWIEKSPRARKKAA